MELIVKEYQLPNEITFNAEQLKAEVQAVTDKYVGLVYTDEQIKEAKADRAKLNKLRKAINDERLRREREYMKPFNDFKAEVAEILAIIDKPIGMIDGQLKEMDEKRQEKKRYEIGQIWGESEHPEWMTLARVFDERWLNTTYGLKQIETDINETLREIAASVAIIEDLPTHKDEALDTYKRTLNLTAAIEDARRLTELDEEKARKAGEEIAAEFAEGIEKKEEPNDGATWLRFAARLTIQQALELKEFFNSRDIEFKAI